jgi:LDH2 family malate/lactate/ureidoglycolate dehydrogenase
LVPGDPERRASEPRRAAGIPVAESTWVAIVAAARGLGVKAE